MRVGGWHNLPFECFCETMLVAFDLEDLDRLIGGACCQSSAVVVKDGVVLLRAISWSFGMRSGRVVRRMFGTYNHVIVTGV
jgi:hypothetical protein